MALAAVLSAMREIILNLDPLQGDSKEKDKFLESRFPDLSKEEREDLAKIPTEKFEIYTRSVFGGERNLLKNLFPMTFARLIAVWMDKYSLVLNEIEFVRRLHQRRPWRGNATVTIADNFVQSIRHDFPELLALAPELVDMGRIEQIALEVKRHISPNLSELSVLSDARISQLTVAELLNQELHFAECIQFETFQFDVISARKYFFANNQQLPKVVEAASLFTICGRNLENFPRWVSLNEGVWQAVRNLGPGSKIPLVNFAEVVVQSCDSGMSEAALFEKFLSTLAELRSAGVAFLISK